MNDTMLVLADVPIPATYFADVEHYSTVTE